MKVTVYNRTDREQGVLIEGQMHVVPAGTPGGGRGSLVVSRRVAEQMIARKPEAFSLAADEYTEDDRAAVLGMNKAALQAFALHLMAGNRPPVREVIEETARNSTAGDGGEDGKGS